MATTVIKQAAPAGAVYGLGFLGALIYYISTASGIIGALFGIFKAIFWPGFLVYHLMEYLGM